MPRERPQPIKDSTARAREAVREQHLMRGLRLVVVRRGKR
jgi:hypothetical protein